MSVLSDLLFDIRRQQNSGRTPLKLGIYRVKNFFRKISYLFGPPLENICSLAPGYAKGHELRNSEL